MIRQWDLDGEKYPMIFERDGSVQHTLYVLRSGPGPWAALGGLLLVACCWTSSKNKIKSRRPLTLYIRVSLLLAKGLIGWESSWTRRRALTLFLRGGFQPHWPKKGEKGRRRIRGFFLFYFYFIFFSVFALGYKTGW